MPYNKVSPDGAKYFADLGSHRRARRDDGAMALARAKRDEDRFLTTDAPTTATLTTTTTTVPMVTSSTTTTATTPMVTSSTTTTTTTTVHTIAPTGEPATEEPASNTDLTPLYYALGAVALGAAAYALYRFCTRSVNETSSRGTRVGPSTGSGGVVRAASQQYVTVEVPDEAFGETDVDAGNPYLADLPGSATDGDTFVYGGATYNASLSSALKAALSAAVASVGSVAKSVTGVGYNENAGFYKKGSEKDPEFLEKFKDGTFVVVDDGFSKRQMLYAIAHNMDVFFQSDRIVFAPGFAREDVFNDNDELVLKEGQFTGYEVQKVVNGQVFKVESLDEQQESMLESLNKMAYSEDLVANPQVNGDELLVDLFDSRKKFEKMTSAYLSSPLAHLTDSGVESGGEGEAFEEPAFEEGPVKPSSSPVVFSIATLDSRSAHL